MQRPLFPGLSRRTAERWHREFPSKPLLSLVVHADPNETRLLRSTLQSVADQFYEDWELLIVADSKVSAEIQGLFENLNGKARIHVIVLEDGAGDAAGLNAAIDSACGRWIGFLGAGAELVPDALTWVVAAQNRCPQAVWFYGDDIDRDIQTPLSETAFLKPAFSPEFLLSRPFTDGLSVFDVERIRRVGGFSCGWNSAGLSDLTLRLSEKTPREQIVHIPRVLAGRGSRNNDKIAAASDAVRAALIRRGVKADVATHPHVAEAFQIRLRPQCFPSARIIIPTHNGLTELQACLDSIARNTRYPNYQITVIDNRSDDPTVLAFLEEQKRSGRIDLVRDGRPFNHSQMHNDVVKETGEAYLVFMNNDVELLTPGWLGEMIATAEMDDSIAGVGGLLLYPDGTIQHGGIYLGRCGIAGHAFRNLPQDVPGSFGQAQLLRETTAATAALLLLKRQAFSDVGGFDAENFPTSFNDVDLWLRLQAKSYRCIYNPQIRAIHHESKSRPIDRQAENGFSRRFQKRWGNQTQSDLFHHPGIDVVDETLRETTFRSIRHWTQEIFRHPPPAQSGQMIENNAA